MIYLPFDGKKALAYVVADNKLAESDWDFTKMADLLTELDDGDFDISLTGWDMDEIEEIINWSPKEPEEKEITAFRKVHILLSLPVDSFIKIKELLEKIKEYKEVEYEQSSS